MEMYIKILEIFEKLEPLSIQRTLEEPFFFFSNSDLFLKDYLFIYLFNKRIAKRLFSPNK